MLFSVAEQNAERRVKDLYLVLNEGSERFHIKLVPFECRVTFFGNKLCFFDEEEFFNRVTGIWSLDRWFHALGQMLTFWYEKIKKVQNKTEKKGRFVNSAELEVPVGVTVPFERRR